MKSFHLLLLLLSVCLACTNKQEHAFTGSVLLDNADVAYTLTLHGSDTTFTITPDSKGQFAFTVPAHGSPFFNLSGVVETPSKWQFSSPVYLPAGTPVHLDIRLTGTQADIRSKDNNNNLLQEYRQYMLQKSKQLWIETPAPDKISGYLEEYTGKARQLIADKKPDKATADFLTTWAEMQYLDACAGLPFIYSRHKGWQLPAEITDIPTARIQSLDKPYWYMFYGTAAHILNSLQRQNDTIEAQVRLLGEQYHTPALRQEVIRQIVGKFLRDYPYSDPNLSRLENLCAGLPERESLLEQYRDKRYSIPGAPLPETEFEDKEGKRHRLTDFKGKYIYIDLWASWCGPCVAEVPHLQKLEKELKNKEVVFVSISLDAKRTDWEKKTEQLGMHGNQWIVTGESFANTLNIKGIPHFLLYGKDGTLLQYRAPRPSSPELRQQLEELP